MQKNSDKHSNNSNNNDDDDDDEDDSQLLLLSHAGCVCCGRSGHNADTCPFVCK